MATNKPAEPQPLKVGDLVKIRNSGYGRVRIVELRGPLGPGGKQVYRVRVRRKPTPAYIEVLEDQLEAVPSHTSNGPEDVDHPEAHLDVTT
jgi:hypothetical protein